MKSKEINVIELFYNDITKHWHFEELIEKSNVTRSKLNNWLKKFIKEKLIKKIKEKNKMPYYLSNYKSINYQNKKRLFAFNKLYQTGFLNHLSSLKKAKTIIIFGGFSRWDWHKKSDIDVFIYGDEEGLSISKYELALHKNIQLFICKNKKELKKLGKGLIKNIITGNIIKGDINFLEVNLNA